MQHLLIHKDEARDMDLEWVKGVSGVQVGNHILLGRGGGPNLTDHVDLTEDDLISLHMIATKNNSTIRDTLNKIIHEGIRWELDPTAKKTFKWGHN